MGLMRELQVKIDELQGSLAEQTEFYAAEAKLAIRLEHEVQNLREQEQKTRYKLFELEEVADEQAQNIQELEKENSQLLEII